MDDKLAQGIAAVYRQQPFKLRRVLHPQPRLDGDTSVKAGEYLAEKAVERLRVAQLAGALSLGRDRPGRTAEIQIDLLIAQRAQLARRPEKILRVAAEQLRHQRHALVVFRQKVAELLWAEHTVLRRGE